MVKWEYQFEIGKFEGFNGLTSRLNELGDEGWEAVGISQDTDDFTVLLKRHKVEHITAQVGSMDAQMQIGVLPGGIPNPDPIDIN